MTKSELLERLDHISPSSEIEVITEDGEASTPITGVDYEAFGERAFIVIS